MNAAAIAGILTGATGLVTAITVLIRQIRHQNGPAHNPGP